MKIDILNSLGAGLSRLL